MGGFKDLDIDNKEYYNRIHYGVIEEFEDSLDDLDDDEIDDDMCIENV